MAVSQLLDKATQVVADIDLLQTHLQVVLVLAVAVVLVLLQQMVL
jgi:hypothetical protein